MPSTPIISSPATSPSEVIISAAVASDKRSLLFFLAWAINFFAFFPFTKDFNIAAGTVPTPVRAKAVIPRSNAADPGLLVSIRNPSSPTRYFV